MTITIFLKGWELALALLDVNDEGPTDFAAEYAVECIANGSVVCWAPVEFRQLTARPRTAMQTQRRKKRDANKQ